MKMRFPGLSHASIQRVLLFTYFILILPPFIIQTIMNTSLIDTYRQELIGSNMQFVNEIKLHMDYNFKELIGMSLTIYSNSQCVDILKKSNDRDGLEKVKDAHHYNDYLQMLIYRNYISGVYIYKPDGEYFFGNCNLGMYNVNVNLQTSQWLKDMMSVGDFHFLVTHKPENLVGGTPVFSLVRNVIDTTSGNHLGLMLIDVNPEMLGSNYRDTTGRLNGKFIITDNKRNIVFHTDKSQQMNKLVDESLNPAYMNNDGYFIYKEGDTEYLASFTTSSLSGWKALSVIPLEKVVAKAISVRDSMIWMAVITILFAVTFSILFSSYISNPLKVLTHYMSVVSNGNFDITCSLKGTKEVHLLGEGFNLMVSRIRDLLKNEFQLKLLKKDAEFKALQAQINPHFLYNTLESISALADIRKAPEIGKTCKILSNMFRYTISTKHESVQIENEVEHLQDYISIIKLRFEDMIDFKIDIKDCLADYEILKFVLQPIVENCINHGFSNMSTKGRVNISGVLKDDIIYFNISDNGSGIPDERFKELTGMLKSIDYNNIWKAWQDNSKSIGLRNIHIRLTCYYGPQYGIISIKSTQGQGTCVTVAIPSVKLQRRQFNV